MILDSSYLKYAEMIPLLRTLGEQHGNLLQYSYLENLMESGTWWATIHGVARVGHNLATKPAPTLRILVD